MPQRTSATTVEPHFRVGVTGHRTIDVSAGPATILAARVRAVFAFIWQTVVDTAPPGSIPQFIVISPLAEGADRLIAHEAVANGFPLHCPLPFAKGVYERDFATEASRREYRALLAQAAVVRELPGEWETSRGRDDAYAAVGRVVVAESDVLMALWDGEAARGSGGTAHVVSDALDRGLPVVWIASEPPHGIRVLRSGGGAWRAEPLATITDTIIACQTERLRPAPRQSE